MRKRILPILLAALMALERVACEGFLDATAGKGRFADTSEADEDKPSKEKSDSSKDSGTQGPEEGDVFIENDMKASYYHDFVNLIPMYEDIPYVAVKGDNLHPDLSYNWFSIVKNNFGEPYPYARLRTAYAYVLSDIYALNGRPDKELEMAQYFYCQDSVSTYNTIGMEPETWNDYDGLLWYMTFLNYHCDIETEEDEYGTLVHARVTNTDMVKLLYEELENTYNMVAEDNKEAAEKRINGAFERTQEYFEAEEENYSHLTGYTYYYRPLTDTWTCYPNYGSSYISNLNLVELAGGLIFEQAKYQLNRQFWGSLSDNGILYYYTLSQMLLRLIEGDYDTVETELTFYAEVDSQGNGYLSYEKDGSGKAMACEIDGNLYDVVEFNYRRDKRSGDRNIPLAADRERAEQVQAGLPLRFEAAPFGPEMVVEAMSSYAAGSLEEILSAFPPEILSKDIVMERMGLDSEEDLQLFGAELLLYLGELSSEEIIMIFSEIAGTDLHEYFPDGISIDIGDNRSGAAVAYIRSLLGEDEKRVISTDEILSEDESTYFRTGAAAGSWCRGEMTISSEVWPVRSTKQEDKRYCEIETKKDAKGNPVCVHLTDGEDVFEYVFTYDSGNRMAGCSYYEYTADRKRDPSYEQKTYEYVYEGQGRLDMYRYTLQGYNEYEVNYVYGEDGRLQQQSYVNRSVSGCGLLEMGITTASETQAYEYGDAGRVSCVTGTVEEVYPHETYTYQYAQVG